MKKVKEIISQIPKYTAYSFSMSMVVYIVIGLIAGAYSSIFMSSSIWVFFENKMTIKRNDKVIVENIIHNTTNIRITK